jgi:FkbM family methyltransferase
VVRSTGRHLASACPPNRGNSIESFLRQSYPNKELVILNDCPGQELVCDAPGVRVVNVDERLPTLGDKRNAAIALARGELIAPWDDDDISLPWRLSLSVERLGSDIYFNPRGYWLMYENVLYFDENNPLRMNHIIENAHAKSLYTRAAFKAVGGYPSMDSGEDLTFHNALVTLASSNSRQGENATDLKIHEWYYIYRWAVSPIHMTIPEGYQQIGLLPVEPGKYRILPHWIIDYEEETRKVLKPTEPISPTSVKVSRKLAARETGMSRKNRVANSKLNRSALEYLLVKDVNLQSCDEEGFSGTLALRSAFFSLTSAIKPTIFCEIGSHDGATAAEIKRIHPACQVYSFEANPEIHATFSDRHRNSGVDYRNLAIDRRSGSVTLFVPTSTSTVFSDGPVEVGMPVPEPANTGRSSLLMRNETAEYSEFDVASSALDRFLKTEGWDVSHQNIALWIDVEGASHRVLKGARRVLSQTSIIFIEMETYEFWKGQRDATHLTSFLIKRGFVPVVRDREAGDFQFNMIFVSAEYLEHVERELFQLRSPLRACMLGSSQASNG